MPNLTLSTNTKENETKIFMSRIEFCSTIIMWFALRAALTENLSIISKREFPRYYTEN